MPTLARRAIDRFVAAHATAARVLDLGCGQGPYAHHFPNRVGCDVAPSQAVHVLADAQCLPFKDETFDFVLSTEMLEHVLCPEDSVREMWRVLRRGGQLLLTTRFLYPIHSAPFDYWRFTRYGLEHLFEGWTVELIAPDVPDSGAARLVAEMALNRHGRWFRWPAKAVVRALHRILHVIEGRLPIDGEPALASGYIVLARKEAPFATPGAG